MSSIQQTSISVSKIKQLLRYGIQAIPPDKYHNQAVLIIGDTGVGKSTLLSYLSGKKLITRYDGIKTSVDTQQQYNRTKIGHNKLSQTFMPMKILIKGKAFYDCAGFRDNKGEQFEIANSFFMQRLVDTYSKIKIVLVVDQSHISEARADKMPRLLHSLYSSFKTFEDIKDGCLLMVSRADKQNTQQDYQNQLLQLMKVHHENIPFFKPQQRKLLEHIINKHRIILFQQSQKSNNSIFIPEPYQNYIMNKINDVSYIKSRSIGNIISQGAKLAIRELIDKITLQSNNKISIMCSKIKDQYIKRLVILDQDPEGIIQLKKQINKFKDQVSKANKNNILQVLEDRIRNIIKKNQEAQPQEDCSNKANSICLQKLTDLQEDFTTVLFFKEVYNKIDPYFFALTNKMTEQLANIYLKIDDKLTKLENNNLKKIVRESEKINQHLNKENKTKEKIQKQGQQMIQQEISSNRKKIDENEKKYEDLRQNEKIKQAQRLQNQKLQEQKRKIQQREIQQNYRKSVQQIQRKRIQGLRKAKQIEQKKQKMIEQKMKRQQQQKKRRQQIQRQNKKKMQQQKEKVRIQRIKRQKQQQQRIKAKQQAKNQFMRQRQQWQKKRKEQVSRYRNSNQVSSPEKAVPKEVLELRQNKNLQPFSSLQSQANLTKKQKEVQIRQQQKINSNKNIQVFSPSKRIKQSQDNKQKQQRRINNAQNYQERSRYDIISKQNNQLKESKPEFTNNSQNNLFAVQISSKSPIKQKNHTKKHYTNTRDQQLKQMRKYWQKKRQQEQRIRIQLENERKQYQQKQRQRRIKQQNQKRQKQRLEKQLQVKRQRERNEELRRIQEQKKKLQRLETQNNIKKQVQLITNKQSYYSPAKQNKSSLDTQHYKISHHTNVNPPVNQIKTAYLNNSQNKLVRPSSQYSLSKELSLPLSGSHKNISSSKSLTSRSGPELISQVKRVIDSLQTIQGDLQKAKSEAINLYSRNKQIGTEFERIQQTYFKKSNMFDYN